VKELSCTFCGDPATELCKKLHLDWIIVLPREIKPGDVWRQPVEEKLYSIKTTKVFQDGVVVQTKQGRKYYIAHLELPVLVRREVPCLWPRCDLHCGKCLMYETQEKRAEELGITEAREAEKRKEAERRTEEQRQRAIERRTVRVNTRRGKTPVRRKKGIR